jgi:hypothetical protein
MLLITWVHSGSKYGGAERWHRNELRTTRRLDAILTAWDRV